MRKGLVLMGNSIAEQVEIARLADSRGFHSIWSTEFFNHHGFVRMTAMAMATQQVQIGSAIAYAFMRTPLLASSAAMDIDEISGGRVILGLGSGGGYSSPGAEPGGHAAGSIKDATAGFKAIHIAADG